MAARPSNRFVRKAIREVMEPQLSACGFSGPYPEFKRTWRDELHFVWFSTAKYGGSFAFQGARAPRGPFKHWDGKIIPETELRFAHTNFDDRASVERMIDLCLLDRSVVSRSVGGFEYAHFVHDEGSCRALVQEAASALPRLIRWLETREPGPGISAPGHRLRSAYSKQLSWHMACGMVGAFDIRGVRPEVPGRDTTELSQAAPEYSGSA
ncbi:hypothetical protein A6F68_02299 [Tsuneonella dongtanensis]|uniref:DUF4304 domain-containing protein n=1 Tax=Tsuneonella dongtanensis TaxID=692370 RepID=A0A1B2AF63_9SPHN|nr:hypothetical protein [Tsuneonella dongtanensis]ANY20799.1 hypothetical protein A6F68_02299 [Tsuneonella dongtanensis]